MSVPKYVLYKEVSTKEYMLSTAQQPIYRVLYNSLLRDQPNYLVGWVDREVGRLATLMIPVDRGPSRGPD